MSVAVTPSAVESKAVRLARYLKEFVGLRSTTIRDVEKYESVLWFSDMPNASECRSPAWNDDFEPGDPWLEVHKQQFPKPPVPPALILPWIDEQSLRQASAEIPDLKKTRLEPDLGAEVVEGEEPPLVERHLGDHPEVTKAYEQFRPGWLAWSGEYRRRDGIQKIYAELFRLHTQVQKQGEIVELVLGLGLLDWPASSTSTSIRRHVVTARVDLLFSPATGVIRLHAAADGAQLRIEDDMLEAELRPQRSHYATVEEQLSAIDDWDRSSMVAALKTWAAALDSDSEWSPDLSIGSRASTKPKVSFAPALLLRKRTQAGMVRTYEAIINQISDSPENIPPGWASLLTDEDDFDELEREPVADGSEAQVHAPTREVYFPLAANREQRRIVEAIERRRGVLVQGPPGTGKSHTIANLMCHLLATGKRVLITAETGRALQVLKEKLPKEIQPLCVSLLGQSGDAFAELNSAVEGITTRFAAWTPGAYDERILAIDRELDARRRSLAETDTELRSLREGETHPHSLMGGAYHGTASAIAERVAAERELFEWLRVPLASADLPPVTQNEMLDWLDIRRRYDADSIGDAERRFTSSKALPAPEEFAASVAGERDAEEAVRLLGDIKRHPAYRSIVAMDRGSLDDLGQSLRKLAEVRREIFHLGFEWLSSAIKDVLAGRQARWQALYEQSQRQTDQIESLLRELGSTQVELPTDKDTKGIRADVAALIGHLQAGGKWTKFGLFTPSVVKERTYLLNQVTVDGQPANSKDRLTSVRLHIDTALAFDDLERAWSDLGGLPKSSERRIRLATAKEQVSKLGELLAYAQDCLNLSRSLGTKFPAMSPIDWINGDADRLLEIVDASVVEERHRAATLTITTCLRELKSTRDLHDAHPVIATILDAVERRDIRAYSEAYGLLCRLERTRRDQSVRVGVESTLATAIPGLTEAIGASLTESAWNDRLSDWERAWRWSIADNWLSKRSNFQYQEELWQRRHSTEAQIRDVLAESASLRAWTHFFARLTPKEAAALKGWREAVRAMGKGKGKSAGIERLRSEARKYMDQCREAIPVWIMPRYLVAEMVSTAPNRYDFVIVDEASQLGIDSLFLFYIAKKMVVVGDDQQISPYGVGIAGNAIAGLQHHYLDGVPHPSVLTAQSSLYTNAKIRFGQNIVLREHFRCMPEIIQFSNDLCYASNGTPLDPLRAYPANRLQPLVLRHVPGGYRTGGSQSATNEAEADAILSQIGACIADPRYAGRTMGVISLQGDAQAKLIERKLLGAIEPEVIEERRLICGDAYAFQGDERHVVFLSMVAAPNERIGALADDSARQRFNVAVSRAQDQLWLFHSAGLDVLSPTCMRYRLLNYLLAPTRRVSDEDQHRFDSKFERDVFRIITDRGFHVRTQVCIGDPTSHRYRIDLVVEGMQGRLAVECDGDEWHGPERYEQDMARQRDLERAGWEFVRIRGGDFYREPSNAMEPLWAELGRLGIKPGGIDTAAAEPPPPIDVRIGAHREVEEKVPVDGNVIEPLPQSVGIGAGDEGREKRSVDAEGKEKAKVHISSDRAAGAGDNAGNRSIHSDRYESEPSGADDGSLPKYAAFEGAAGPDPRTSSLATVTDGLIRIIEAEGPMLAKRAYDVYLRGCGIKRLGGELKSTMNKALMSAIHQGRVASKIEPGDQGVLNSTIWISGKAATLLRDRGSRTFEEIPPDELRAASELVLQRGGIEQGSDDHLRAILSVFDLRRLTIQVGTALLEILAAKGDNSSPPDSSAPST